MTQSTLKQQLDYHYKVLVYGYVHFHEIEYKLSRQISKGTIKLIFLLFSFDYNVSDLSMLNNADISTIMENLETRYCKLEKKYIYTFASTNILISINPYKDLSIYGQDIINQYQNNKNLSLNIPHIFGVAATAYLRMINNKQNQSIIFCGESGSGKTENSKLLIRYLTDNKCSNNSMKLKILSIYQILESFGNAKTVINDNASRFGLFLKLFYNINDKKMTHCCIVTYLLETSRVVRPVLNERNYHIAYQLYYGIPSDQHNKYSIIRPNECHYTNQGGCIQVPGIDDKQQYNQLIYALNSINIDETTQHNLWSILSGIFNLGNITFKRESDGFASICSTTSLFRDNVANLWGIDSKSIDSVLTTKSTKIMRKTILKKIGYDACAANRDLIAKNLYKLIFSYLVKYINDTLYSMNDKNKNDDDDEYFIGIVDMFGFANFSNNSLEQFCINFANEKLNQLFIDRMVRSKQKEYSRERLLQTSSSIMQIPNNIQCIDMIGNKQNGLFTLLGSSCSAPIPDHHSFLQELFKKHGSNPCIKKATCPGAEKSKDALKKQKYKDPKNRPRFDGFEIKHYIENVTYDAEHFLSLNREKIHVDPAEMMKKSTNTLLCDIVTLVPMNNNGMYLTEVYNEQIQVLMRRLWKTEPFFVQCINPNITKSSNVWSEWYVKNQLSVIGAMGAMKMLKARFFASTLYTALCNKYTANSSNVLIKNISPKTFCIRLLNVLNVGEEEYELGLTKIFLKSNTIGILNKIIHENVEPLSMEQEDEITKWVIHRRIQQINGVCRAYLKLRNIMKKKMNQREEKEREQFIRLLKDHDIDQYAQKLKDLLDIAKISDIQYVSRGQYIDNNIPQKVEQCLGKMFWKWFNQN